MIPPQNHEPDATPEDSAIQPAELAPEPPTGLSTTGPPPKRSQAALAAMWGLMGALASGGGAAIGFIFGLSGTSSCTGMFCGFEEAFSGALIGWVLGALFAILSAASGEGSGSDKFVHAFYAIAGVVGLPMALALPALL